MSNDATVDIVLWGDSQVGKTTALSSYLCDRTPSWVDPDADETFSTTCALLQIWNALRSNRLPPGTVRPDHYAVRHRDGRIVRFRDMKGGNALDLARNGSDAEALRTASAVMVFVEWPERRSVQNVVAACNALLCARAGARVLVVTKVERYLAVEAVGQFALDPVGVARSEGLPSGFVDLLGRVSARDVFPVSVFGFAPDGRPAHYQDEYGRLVPWNVRPRGVDLPFERVLGDVTGDWEAR